MTKASDNPFPYMQYVEQGSTPSNPASGSQRLFVRSSDHILCMVNSSGTVVPLSGSLANPMTAVGDIIQGTTAGAPTNLAAPAAGKVLTGAGTTTPLVYAYPPGYELDYAPITGDVTVTGTTAAGGTTVITGNSVAYDGSTAVYIEFCASQFAKGTTYLILDLWEDSTDIARIAATLSSTACFVKMKRTPAAGSHTYKVTGYVDAGSGNVYAGAGGGADTKMPAFLRVVKA